jgi:hypothetical protein
MELPAWFNITHALPYLGTESRLMYLVHNLIPMFSDLTFDQILQMGQKTFTVFSFLLIGPDPLMTRIQSHIRAVKEPLYCLKEEREEESNSKESLSMAFLGLAMKKELGNGVGREKTHSHI